MLPIDMNQYANDFNRTTQIYYNDLKKYKPLTKAKERRLLRKCKMGNIDAKNEIIKSNLRFVFDIAKHYTGRGVSILELISEGNMGLIKAIDKFDESKDVKFISYAVWWIRQSILESIKKRNLVNFVGIESDKDNDSSIDNRKIEDEEDDNVQVFNNFSTENEDGYNEVNENRRKIISKIIETLSGRERDIIEKYYGLNENEEQTLTDIGKKYGLSSERVRHIKKQSLKKLRSKILMYNFENLYVN